MVTEISELVRADRELIWHPFTQEKTADLPICIMRGESSYLFDENGKQYLDLISSWWLNLHGHSNKKISEAIYEQSKKLEHVIFAGFTHQPAVELCKKLKQILPNDGLDKFFFSLLFFKQQSIYI
jgi:adenosylmethionine-8-amino-7-oxononanoate aminotransferase